MNHVFRVVWSVASGQWVVASELATAPRRRPQRCAMRSVLAAAAMASTCHAVAADRTFDGNGASPPNPSGSGLWNTSDARWFDGTTFRAWDNAALDRAVFGVPGNVTLDAPIVAGALHFQTGTTVLAGTQLLTLDGARTISLGDDATAMISTPLTGGFRLTGGTAATLQISGNNAGVYSGTTVLGAGPRLVLGHAQALGSDTRADALVLEDGARLEFGTNGSYAYNATLAGGIVRIVPRASGGTWSGAPTLTAPSAIVYGVGNAGSQAWTGRFADTGPHALSLTIDAAEGYGPTLSAPNTHTGETRIRSGQLSLANSGALSPQSALVFDGSGEVQSTLVFNFGGVFARTLGTGAGELRWDGSGGFGATNARMTVTLDDNAPLTWGAGHFVPDGSSLHVGNNIVFTNAIELGALERTVFGNGTLGGSLHGGGGLRLREGVLTLAAANTFDGATILNARRASPFDAQIVLGDAQALPGGIGVSGGTSALVIDGGVLVLGAKSGDFLRGLGDGAHEVRFLGSGGFGSAGGLRTVDIGGAGDTLAWGVGGFVPDGASLAFASHGGGASVLFRNGIDLAGEERTIQLASTGITPQRAVRFDGVFGDSASGGGLRLTGFGEAFLANANTYTGRTLIGDSDVSTRAVVSLLADGGMVSGIGASGRDAANLVLGSRGTYSFATLSYVGAGASTDRNFTMSGNAELLSDGSGALTWNGSPLVTAGERMLRLGGAQDGVFTGLLADGGGRLSIAKYGAGTWRLTGTNTFSGSVQIGGVGSGAPDPGALEVDALGNAHEAGNLGINASNAANKLVLHSRGVLRYVGNGESTDRNLMRGLQSGVPNERSFGIALESSGSGALDWRGRVTMQNSGNTWFRLGGTNHGDNRFSSMLANSAQAVSLAKEGRGTWSLANANTYTGATEIVDGVLRLDHANALAGGLGANDTGGSSLRLSGGVLGLTAASGDLLRRLDGSAGRNGIAWTESGGFAAFGGMRAVDLGGTGTTLAWGAPDFLADGAHLLLSHRTADATLDLRNGIDFAQGERVVDVADGAHGVDGVLSGVLSGHGASGLVKTGAGTLRMTGDNTYAGRTRIQSGVLEVERIGDAGRTGNLGTGVEGADALQIDGATLRYVGTGDASDRGFTVGPGGATLDALGSGAMALDGDVRVSGDLATLHLRGDSNAANRVGGTLGNSGSLAVEKAGTGTWVLTGDSALADLVIREGVLQLGDGGTSGSVGDGVIRNDGTLAFARGYVATFSNRILGAGALLQRGTGTTVLSGVGSEADLVDVALGTLQVEGVLESRQLRLGDGTLRVVGRLQGLAGMATTITGTIDSDARLSVEASGLLHAWGDLGDGTDTLEIAGTVDSGTGVLSLGEGDDTLRLRDGALLAGSIRGGDAGLDTVSLEIAQAFDFDPASVGGFERLHKVGAGVARLVGDGAYLDGVDIASGTLRIAAGLELSTPTIRVSNDAALVVDGRVVGGAAGLAHVVGDAGASRVEIAAGGHLDASGALGAGSDTLDVAGVLDIGAGRFDLGDGDDHFVVHDGAHVIGAVDGGAGNDTRVYAIENLATLGSLLNFEAIEKRGGGTLAVTGSLPTAVADVDVLDGILRVGAGASIERVAATTVSAGATLAVDGLYLGTDGNDTFLLAGTLAGGGSVQLAKGDDALVLRDGATLANRIDGGDGIDQVVLDATRDMVFDATSTLGFEQLRKRSSGEVTLANLGGSDFVAGVEIEQGTLAIGTAHMLRTSSIALQDGAALRVFGRATDLGGLATQLTGDGGINAVRVDAGAALHASGDLGAGDDVLDVAGTLDTVGGPLVLGDGDDRFVVHDGTLVLGTVDGGAGEDTRVYDIGGTATVGALDQFEALEKRGDGTLRIDGPETTRLAQVDVLGGQLHVRAAGALADVRNTTVARDAMLRVDGGFAGTATGDTLTVAGRIEGAGRIDLAAGDDMLFLLDGADLSGLANALTGGDGEDQLVVDISGVASLAGVAEFEWLDKRGDGSLRILGAAPSDLARVSVADGHLFVGAAGSIADVVDTRIDAGATLHVDGRHAGSAGDDVFTVAGTVSGNGTVDLGAGDDALIVQDGASFLNGVHGGDGNADTVVLDAMTTLAFDGTPHTGFERLHKRNDGRALLVGANDAVYAGGVHVERGALAIDRLHALHTTQVRIDAGAELEVDGLLSREDGSPTDITGDAGANHVRVGVDGALRATADLGAGDDVLDIAGTLDTGGGVFALGDGDDRFVVRDGTVVLGTVDGGDGLDTRDYDLAGTARLGALLNFEAIAKRGRGSLHIDGPRVTDVVRVEVHEGTLAIGRDGAIAGVADTLVDTGATLQVDGAFTGSSAADTLVVAGTVAGTGSVQLDAGDDVLVLRDGASLAATIEGGAHTVADALVLDTALAFAFDGGRVSGFERLEKRNAGVATLTGDHRSRFDAGVGIDEGVLTIGVRHVLETSTLAIAAGASLQIEGQVTGDADATAILQGDAGANHVRIAEGGLLDANGDLGAGDDVLDVAGTLDTGGGSFLLGDGDDTFIVHDTTRVLGTLDAGAGNDRLTVAVRNGAHATLDDTAGFESLGKAGQGSLAFEGAAAFADVAVLEGTLNVAAGAAIEARSTYIAQGAHLRIDGTFAGTDRDDVLEVGGDVAGVGGIALGTGDDTLVLRDGADLSGLATSVDGGAGSDRLQLDVVGTATLGGAVGFERLEKFNEGTLRIAGPAGSEFDGVEVLQGRLEIGAAGSIDGVQALGIAADALLENAGRIAFSTGDDAVRIDGALATHGTFDLGAGNDVIDASGTLSGAVALGAGDDRVRFTGGTFDAVDIDAGEGAEDRLAFVGMALDAGQLPGFRGFEFVQLAAGTALALDRTLALQGRTLDIDAMSRLSADGMPRIEGSVSNAGLVQAQRARIGIGGDYTASGDALLVVDVATSAGVAGGLDIDGTVRGRTGVVFRGDGTTGFSPASILIVSAPNAGDVAGDAFFASEAEEGVVRLAGNPYAWRLIHDATARSWSLETGDAPSLVPELPGIAVLPTLGLAAVEDVQRTVFERLEALRGEVSSCAMAVDADRTRAVRAGACRDAWMAAVGNELRIGPGPGFGVRGDTQGLLAGVDRVMPSREGTVFLAGAHAGLLRGDHVSSADDAGPVRVGAARLRTTTPVAGFHASVVTDGGQAFDATLDAQRSRARVSTGDGYVDGFTGSRIALRLQATQGFDLRGWRLAPQLALGVMAQQWGDRYDTGGRDLLLADDVVAHARAGLRVERRFASASFASVRPWVTVALDDTFGEAREALRLRSPGGGTFSLPGHDLRAGASLEAGVEAEGRNGVRLFATVAAGGRAAGTETTQRSATVGVRWAW